MQIRVRPSVREVVATYTVDDGSMELIVVIPPNFPLGAVKVETGKKVGVGNNLWRNWMLQLTTFLQVRVSSWLGLTKDLQVRLFTYYITWQLMSVFVCKQLCDQPFPPLFRYKQTKILDFCLERG